MSRSPNAQLAVDLYNELRSQHSWTGATAWRGFALLLLSCELYRARWETLHDVVVYAESNRLKMGKEGPHATLSRAEHLTTYLATQLGVTRRNVCKLIGTYWRHPKIRPLQPHNPTGHAFRSLVTNALQTFGDPTVAYEEDVAVDKTFSGNSSIPRTVTSRIDIVARRSGRPVAVILARWRLRHNRMLLLDEAPAYVPALTRENPNAKVYAVVGEFDGGRLRKLLASAEPQAQNAAISAAVHFAPQLIREGLGENGSLEHLRSLEWLIKETFRWD